jgi:hypothetical protein
MNNASMMVPQQEVQYKSTIHIEQLIHVEQDPWVRWAYLLGCGVMCSFNVLGTLPGDKDAPCTFLLPTNVHFTCHCLLIRSCMAPASRQTMSFMTPHHSPEFLSSDWKLDMSFLLLISRDSVVFVLGVGIVKLKRFNNMRPAVVCCRK